MTDPTTARTHAHRQRHTQSLCTPRVRARRKNFTEAYQDLCAPIVTATIDLYNNIRSDLLPTPSKSHYTFNLRDLSKVVQGCMRCDPKSTTDSKMVRVCVCVCMCVCVPKLSWAGKLEAMQTCAHG